MFDLNANRPTIWPEHLKPVGEGEIDKEDFTSWWLRNSDELSHLHPLICEQWVHRHWTHSPFSFLPLDTLRWSIWSEATPKILDIVYREWAQTLSPEFDLSVFQRKRGDWQHPTAVAIDAGTWDFPIITLSTPNGIVGRKGNLPEVRLVLVEGHQRHRYLNALNAYSKAPAGPHEMFVLETPIVNE